MKKLIVIDDEAIVIRGIGALLNRLSMDITMTDYATNGLDGLEKIKKQRPDIAMVDIRMPGMDGLSLIEKIKEMDSQIIVIIISGYTDFAYTQKAIQLGVSAYIDKPLTLEKMKAVLEQVSKVEKKRASVSDEAVLQALSASDTEAFEDHALQYMEVLRRQNKEDRAYARECYRFLCVIREQFMEHLDEEIAVPHLSYSAFVDEPSYRMTKELARDFISFIVNYQTENTQTIRHDVIRKVLNYIEEHYDEDIGLTFLADYVNLNATYLSILFKEEVGTSFVKYMKEYRMKKAKKMIIDGVKISDVARLVGYNSYRYFSEIFKKQVGVSPNEYRNKKSGIQN